MMISVKNGLAASYLMLDFVVVALKSKIGSTFFVLWPTAYVVSLHDT